MEKKTMGFLFFAMWVWGSAWQPFWPAGALAGTKRLLSNIVDVILFTAIGEDRQLDLGLPVFADGATASANISQRGKQPRDLAEQGLSDDLSSFQC